MFLVGALMLAMTFVILAMLLNSAIYTENFATRGQATIDSGEVATFSDDLDRSVGQTVTALNEDTDVNHFDTQLEPHLVENASDIGNGTEQLYADRGLLLTIGEPEDTVNGTRIVQDSNSGFNSPGSTGDEAWTVAENVQVRKFVFDVTQAPAVGGFTLTVDDGSGTTTQIEFDDDTTGSDDLSVDVVGGGSCEAETPAEVNLFDATVGDSPCPALETLDDTQAPYDITYDYDDTVGTSIEGTYELTVNETLEEFDSSGSQPESYNSKSTGQQPWAIQGIYKTDIPITYRSEGVIYEGEIRVAPGEQDD